MSVALLLSMISLVGCAGPVELLFENRIVVDHLDGNYQRLACHPVPLETRREHKYVGCQIQFDDTLRWDGAEHRDPVVETVGRDIGVEPRSGGQVAGPVTSDGQP